MMRSTTAATLAIGALAVVSLASCRFKAPSGTEGQALVERGVFAGSAPAWINQNASENPAPASDVGIVPRSYSPHPSVETARTTNPNTASFTETQMRERLKERLEQAEARTSALETEEDTASPLARIEQDCPELETQVNDALLTENTDQRVRKYEAMTRRCPDSADLWLWLGKDYRRQEELVKAAAAFEKALVLDPQREEAKTLLDEVKAGLNEQPEK